MFCNMKRITVTRNELERAIRVWLRVMPKRVWRKYEAYERLAAEKRAGDEDRPQAREEMASYIAGKFAQAGWEITYPERRP